MTQEMKQAVERSFRNGIEAGVNSLSSEQLHELVIAPYLELQDEYVAQLELAA